MTPEQSIIEELKSKHESEIAALQDGMRTALKNWQWQERCLKDAIDKSAEEIKRLREDLQMVINAAHHFDTCRRCAEAESCYSGSRVEGGTMQIACIRCNDGSTPLYCLNCAEELLKIEQLRNEVRVLREALRKIADVSQMTAVTFEVQAFTAADIAISALKEGK